MKTETRVVRIKTWDEIIKIGELDEDGDVELNTEGNGERMPYFVSAMKMFCGNVYSITFIDSGIWELSDGNENWSISEEMIGHEYFPNTHPEYFI